LLILLGHIAVGVGVRIRSFEGVVVKLEVEGRKERQLDHAACIWMQENGPNKAWEDESYGGQFEREDDVGQRCLVVLIPFTSGCL
jgi:hypothetical protein